ncbi:hypothetical protein B566_EDAN016676 [Ephemera danica]|nr:hypothetical protein B566_EDAN016676 [Ephemera danica]
MRHLDPRASRPMDQDLRMPPMIPQPIPPRDPRAERAFPAPDGRDFEPTFTRDPRRDRDMRDPRGQFEQRPDPRAGPPVPMPVPQPRPVAPPPQPPPAARPATIPPAIGGGSASDQEKAQLIMQVLQLSDEQIAMLPPEQRQSILVLKEQIAKSTQR